MLLNAALSTQMLASVTNLDEAKIALEAGVDIIDLKNPLEGALGALPLDVVSEIVCAVHHQRIVSATIGNLPMQPHGLLEATQAMLATGVDVVKIGFFGQHHHSDCLQALKPIAEKHKLIAVLFADEAPDFGLLRQIADAGFYGVMLDTAQKNGPHLCHYLSGDDLRAFVFAASELGLQSGLAGSLKAEDVADLLLTKPSYLGFRGALCEAENRISSLQASKVIAIKALMATV